MHVHLCARACGGQSSILMLILSSSIASYSLILFFFFFEVGSLTERGSCLVRLAGQKAQGLSSPASGAKLGL